MGVRNHHNYGRRRPARRSDLLVAEPPTVRDWIVVRWHPAELDHELADGTPPEDSAALQLRARRLTRFGRRRSMAAALRRILRDVQAPRAASRARIAPVRERVAAASSELASLADALAEPGPVAARGAAEARMLLTDGTGPLYNPCSRADLQVRARRATEHLRTLAM